MGRHSQKWTVTKRNFLLVVFVLLALRLYFFEEFDPKVFAAMLSSPAVTPIPDLEVFDLWEVWDHWEDQEKSLKKSQYRQFIEDQGSVQVLLTGTVSKVTADRPRSRDCIVVVRKKGYSRYSNVFRAFSNACSQVEDLNEGDFIQAICVVEGVNFLGNPDIEDCEVK